MPGWPTVRAGPVRWPGPRWRSGPSWAVPTPGALDGAAAGLRDRAELIREVRALTVSGPCLGGGHGAGPRRVRRVRLGDRHARSPA